jgi:membrane-bound serine protease (ClpP class)
LTPDLKGNGFMRLSRLTWTSLAAVALAAAVFAQDQPVEQSGEKRKADQASALMLRIDGPIGPATGHYISVGLDRARDEGHTLVILQMDTPGGLDTSMRDIIKDILASPVPVVTFVAPKGARAASAGTYILYASHVAAMAPATNLGSATPVQIGGEPTPSPIGPEEPDQDQSKDEKQDQGKDKDEDKSKTPEVTKPARLPDSAMERKVINDAVGYIRGLAELRGRNADWAEKAVREGANLQASAALEQNVIDLIAEDTADLLVKLDGRVLKLGASEQKLATRNLTIDKHEPDWRTELLSVLTNPTVAYGLLLIGIYGLLFEGYNPGAVLPGVAGAICLLLALFAFQVLPVNYAGLALIVLGTLLVVAEAFVPSFGTLGVGGVISFVIGSIMLFDTDVPGFEIALPLIGGVATAAALVLAGSVWLFNRARRRPIVTGVEQIVGAEAEALADFSESGNVRLGGEIWRARSGAPVRAGQRVRVVRVEGLLLHVEPI